jgi:hypothetical protein
MSADAQLFPTRLSARLLAFSWTMTLLLTFVGTTPEGLPTDISAADVRKPAGLVLQHIFAAQTRLGRQEWTFGTIFLVSVTIVRHLRVTAVFRTLTCEATRWWFCAAR